MPAEQPTLTLHMHPLASYCWKVLIALYEAVHPYRAAYPALAAYFERLVGRPSVQRVIREAQPWLQYFPFVDALEARFLAVPTR